MSAYPDSVLKRGGFRTSKSIRDTGNARYKCPYCPKDGLLYTSYGLHILKNHLPDIFDTETKEGKANRTALCKKNFTTAPLVLDDKDGNYTYWCLGCASCYKTEAKAQSHFKNKNHGRCLETHKENLLSFRDTYPVGVSSEARPSLKKKAALEGMIDDMLETIRLYEHRLKIKEPFDYESKYGCYFEEWTLDIKEETFREGWRLYDEEVNSSKTKEPTPPPSPPNEEELPPLAEEEDDLLPLYTEKPLTKLDVFNQLSEEDRRGLLEAMKPSASSSSHYSIPKPQHDFYLPKSTKQENNFPSVKIIQSTKRPPKQVTG